MYKYLIYLFGSIASFTHLYNGVVISKKYFKQITANNHPAKKIIYWILEILIWFWLSVVIVYPKLYIEVFEKIF